MRLIFFFLILSTILCASSLYILGDSNNYKDEIIKSKNSILWSFSNSKWNASEPINDLNIKNIKKGFVLVNNSTKDYSTKGYTKTTYELKKGWNYLPSAKDGVDIQKSFKNNKEVEFVYVYDKASQAWAGYSPNEKLMDKIVSTRILYLKYIEPNIGFYAYALKDTRVDIKNTSIAKSCQEKIDAGYSVITASGIDKEVVYNKEKNIGIKSRYSSHYKRGVYDDTRVLLIYSKTDKKSNTKLLKYGPASPRVMLHYTKEYQEKHFFIYDYLNKGCYEGILPSMKIPPFSSLKKLK